MLIQKTCGVQQRAGNDRRAVTLRDVVRRLVIERGHLGAASGWIVEALKVLDTVDPDDADKAERLAALVKAGEMLALATLARSKTPNVVVTGPL